MKNKMHLTIKVFLPTGDPKEIRILEVVNWSGQSLASPRNLFDDLLKRHEMANSGVYMLTGRSSETGDPTIYIGEAEVLKDRVRAHSIKEFWNQIVVFTSKDGNLTKSHIKYIEGKLIGIARSAKRYQIDNGAESGSRLPESDRADMDVFVDYIMKLSPIMGVDAFVPLLDLPANKNVDSKLYLTCEIKGIIARGAITNNGFVVFKGSQAVLENRLSAEIKQPYSFNKRNEYINVGILVRKEKLLEFTQDVEFSSPSGAASVIHGGSANGRIAWKYDDGKTIADLENEKSAQQGDAPERFAPGDL